MTVDTLAREIRDLVNEPRRKYRLRRTPPMLEQAVAALDVLGDTEWAVAAYWAQGALVSPRPDGALYLSVYGLLNAFVLQQDAANNLAEALEIKTDFFKNYTELVEVRDWRVRAAGHPSKKGVGDAPKSYHLLFRDSMSLSGFQLRSTQSDGSFADHYVNLYLLSDWQRMGMTRLLSDIITKVRSNDSMHSEEFRCVSLEQTLGSTTYEFEKLSSTGFGGSAPDFMGRGAAQTLAKRLGSFKDELQRRELDIMTYPGISDIWPEVVELLSRLRQYFDGDQGTLDYLTAYALAHLLRCRFQQLRIMAREIDEEYAS